MIVSVAEPEEVEIPGVARRAQMRVRDDLAEVSILRTDLLAGRALRGRTIAIDTDTWLVTEAKLAGPLLNIVCRRLSDA